MMMNEKKSPKEFPYPFLFLLILLVLLLIQFGVTLFLQNKNRNDTLTAYSIQIRSHIETQRTMMLTLLSKVGSELIFVSRLNEFQEYIENKTDDKKQLVEKELLEFIKITANYDQIRYIDKSGMEKIRINLNNGIPTAVPAEKMQNKSDRYYLRNTLNLPAGTVYVSPFDLNVEQGKIEQPRKPMLRFSIAVRNKKGEPTGILIFNFLGTAIIKNFKQATMDNPGTYSLLNPGGYWLYNDNVDNEWGFMFNEKSDKNLMKTNPVIWNKVTSEPEAQFLLNGILYTSMRVVRNPDVPSSSGDDFYVLLNTISATEMGISREDFRRNLLKRMIPATIISIFISALLTVITVQRNRYRQALVESALYDQLTGLPNRKLLQERGDVVSINARRYSFRYAVMFIDLDGFKPVNDKYGHATGDRLLKEVASILKNSIRESDTAARFGGDEFIILLSRINSSEDCSIIAGKILSALSAEITIKGLPIRTGASIGIVTVNPESKKDFNSVIMSADDVMYEVKKEGKNNFKIV